MILNRPTLDRKSPTGAYGDALVRETVSDLTLVKPSGLVPFVPFAPFEVLLASPLAGSFPLHEGHMVATIEYRCEVQEGWRVRGGI